MDVQRDSHHAGDRPARVRLVEVLTPTVPRPAPKADEVLVRVRASSLNFADVAMITGRPALIRAVSGLRRPKHTVPGKDSPASSRRSARR